MIFDDRELLLSNVKNINLSEATPIQLKKILLQNKNIPLKEIPNIIKKIKERQKKGVDKETQDSLLNTSLKSWNNYYDMKALPQNAKILILPSESVNYRREHAKYYYHEITVKRAIELEFFVNNCRCGFELL